MARSGRQAGRPPKPTELKVLQGNPGHRPIGKAVRGEIPVEIPEPPAHLGEHGRRAWDLYWHAGRLWLATTDIPIMVQLCEFHDEEARLREALAKESIVVLNEKTGASRIHHLYNDLLGVRRSMRELWSITFMTPTDRARANLSPPSEDPLDAWEAARAR